MNNNQDWVQIGLESKNERISLGATQAKIATLIGCSEKKVRRFEQGKVVNYPNIFKKQYNCVLDNFNDFVSINKKETTNKNKAKKTRLNEFFTNITCEGKRISFRDFLNGISNDSILYENDDYGEMIDSAFDKDVFWGDVQDYLSPIVEHILIETVQDDRETYIELLTAIKNAYNKLKMKGE